MASGASDNESVLSSLSSSSSSSSPSPSDQQHSDAETEVLHLAKTKLGCESRSGSARKNVVKDEDEEDEEHEDNQDDNGSDLSALTSEQEQELEDGHLDELAAGVGLPRGKLDVKQEYSDHDDDDVLLDLDSSNDDAQVGYSTTSRVKPASSTSSSGSSADSTTTSRGDSTSKRARGRPPTKRNALAAAAKRQAGKSRLHLIDGHYRDDNGTSLGINGRDGDEGDDDGDDDNDEEDEDIRLNARSSSSSSSSSTSTHDPTASTDRTKLSPTSGSGPGKRKPQSSPSERPERPDSPRRQARRRLVEELQNTHTTSRSHSDEEQRQDEEDEEITSEAEQRLAPLPPAIDNSSDEDYQEGSRNRPAKRKSLPPSNVPARAVGGRKGASANKKAVAARARTAAVVQKLNKNAPEHLSPASKARARQFQRLYEDGDPDGAPSDVGSSLADDDDPAPPSLSHTNGGDEDHTNHANIVITEVQGHEDDTRLNDEEPEYNAHSAAPFDTEDAMSAVSDDVPILLKATARAKTAAHLPSSLSIPSFTMTDLAKDVDNTEDEPMTPIVSLAVQSPTARGRGRSPGGGRGRGRGHGRGRGKKALQQRLLEHDDHDASAASATEDAQEGHLEGSPHLETPSVSDHEEETTDGNAIKKRTEALEALTKIEIEFARLRDRLYLERMDEVARERWEIENGTHPELLHLTHVVERRRTTRMALAERVLRESDTSLTREAEADYRAVWYDWNKDRYEIRRGLMEEANVKRRRLDREKRAVERSRTEDLASVLRMHAPPPTLYFEKKSASVYGQDYSLEYDVADNMSKKRKGGAVGLDQDEALYDMERMGLRDPYRGAFAPHFAFDPAYGSMSMAPPAMNVRAPQGHAGSDYQSAVPTFSGTYDATGAVSLPGLSHQSHHPLAAQGRTVASVSQHDPLARHDLFGGFRAQAAGALTMNPVGLKSSLARPTLDDHLANQVRGVQAAAHTSREHGIMKTHTNRHESGLNYQIAPHMLPA